MAGRSISATLNGRFRNLEVNTSTELNHSSCTVAYLHFVNPSSRADKLFMWLWLLLALGLTLSVRLHHLNMPLERDEGEFAEAGARILEGGVPYKDFYNAKFPGTYLVYALILCVFGKTTAAVHLGVLIFSLATSLLVFLTARRWVSAALAGFAALCLSIMSLSPTALTLAGHATHFVSFFAVAAMLCFVIAREKNSRAYLLAAGICAGFAMLMKQQGAFVMMAFAIALLMDTLRKRKSVKALFGNGLLILAGFAAVMTGTLLWLASAGAAGDARYWAWDFAGAYSAMLPLRTISFTMLPGAVDAVMGNWLMWLLGIAGAIWVFVRRMPLSYQGLPGTMLVLSLLSVIPGLFFRPHYFIVCFPFIALSLVNWLQCHAPRMQKWGVWLSLLAMVPAGVTFHHIWWIASPRQASEMIYGTPLFAEMERVATFAKEHTKDGGRILMVGSEPQLYFLSGRRSATGFLYWYTHTDDHKMQAEMHARFEREASDHANSTGMVVFVNHRSSLTHFPIKNGHSTEWLDHYLRQYHFEQSWVLIPEGEQLRHFRPFSSPDEPHWLEVEGQMARELRLPPEKSFIAVFTRSSR